MLVGVYGSLHTKRGGALSYIPFVSLSPCSSPCTLDGSTPFISLASRSLPLSSYFERLSRNVAALALSARHTHKKRMHNGTAPPHNYLISACVTIPLHVSAKASQRYRRVKSIQCDQSARIIIYRVSFSKRHREKIQSDA